MLKRFLTGLVFLSIILSNLVEPFTPAKIAQAAGTPRMDVAVLVNSQSSYYLDFQNYIQPYLDNFGVPYTVLDIVNTLIDTSIGDYAEIIIGHRQLDVSSTPYLDNGERNAISLAVYNGTGLVNFDNDLSDSSLAPRYLFIQDIFTFGYTSGLTSGSGVVFPSSPLHYITNLHQPNDRISTGEMFLPGLSLPGDVFAIGVTDSSQPFLSVTTYQNGRAVQWGSYEWMDSFVKGPQFGLDDLVWRSIVWAARKPFAMQGLPPFATMRMDDVSGPLTWIHDAYDYGFLPWAGIFTEDIDTEEALDLSNLVNGGKATANMHAFSTSNFFYFNHGAGSNFPDGTIDSNFATATKWFKDRDISISKYVVPHYYEIGSNAFSGLQAWGTEFVGTMMDPGQLEASATWMAAGPYRVNQAGQAYDRGQNPFYADYMTIPGHTDLNNKFFNCITEIRDVTGYEWLGNGRTSVSEGTQDGTAWLKRSFDSMTLATLFSHEYTFVNTMSSSDWRSILQGVTQNIASYSPIYVSMDYACQYLRAIHNSNITGGEYDSGTNRITAHFGGTSDMATKFYVFTEQAGEIQQNLLDVPILSGPVQIDYTLPGPLTHINITPNPASVIAGVVQQFSAIGYDASNNVIPNLSFTWRVAHGGGSIDNHGLFTAGLTTGQFSNTIQASIGSISGLATVNVTETTIHHFSFDAIASPQYKGVPFTVTIRARDINNNPVVTYTGTANLSASAVNFQPAATSAFINGVWSGKVTFSDTASGVSIMATDGPNTGVTGNFDVTTLRACPCSIWNNSVVPPANSVTEDDNKQIEVGVKFRSTVDGYITGLRFYKDSLNSGTHIGHLWTSSGALLAEATFSGESTLGWQEVTLSTPIQVMANTTYIASYHSTGYYTDTVGNLNSAVDNAPLVALANGGDGPNGLYVYGTSGSFPTQAWQASNYWVDVVFDTHVGPDTTAPIVLSVSPANQSSNFNISSNLNVIFNEAMDLSTITTGNFELRDSADAQIPMTVSYNVSTRTATLVPVTTLAYTTVFTAKVLSGANGVKDLAGNALASDYTWSFTTAAVPPPPLDEGTGGPILIITDATNASNPFGRYYTEILRAEGFNAFLATDISKVSSTTLSAYDVVLLAEMPLNSTEITMLDTWVMGGGKLIAFRPAGSLAALYGLSVASGTTSEGYLSINTTTSLGQGIVGSTLQFHGAADHYNLSGASSLATLYSDATTATTYPAVASYSRGSGQVMIFTFDLARSIIYMRQGNPNWAGQEADGAVGIRASDMFVGRNGQPNWIDTSKMLVPQADEEMHMLSHAIEQFSGSTQPLPRLWYFPGNLKGALIMTGDSEGCDGACVNAPMVDVNAHGGHYTAYLLGNGPSLSDVSAWINAGNGAAPHYDDTANASNPIYSSMDSVYESMTQSFFSVYGFAPRTARNHWIVWSGWSDQAEIEAAHGIQLDTNYYHWGSWLSGPGFFTGSGLPMRFSDPNGKIIDIYQATTQLPDETFLPAGVFNAFKTLIDGSLDQGYYGFLTANFHPPNYGSYQSAADAMMTYATSRGVPIWSAEMLLDFSQARNQARLDNINWEGTHLTFDFTNPEAYNGLTLMIPAKTGGHDLQSILVGGSQVTFTKQMIKGYEYAFFTAVTGSYQATYAEDTVPPTITNRSPVSNSSNVAINANITVTFSEAMNPATINTINFSLRAEGAGSDVPISVSYDSASFTATLHPSVGLDYSTLYHMTVSGSAADLSNNLMGGDVTWSFTSEVMPPPSVTDTTSVDFNAGTLDSCVIDSTNGDGAVRLSAAIEENFSGSNLPAGWVTYDWPYDGKTGTFGDSNGSITLDGVRANPDPTVYGPGRSLEFVATFAAVANQHIGFGSGGTDIFDNTPPAWAIFSTGSTGTGLQARTWSDAGHTDYIIPGDWFGTPHTYRIDWTATTATYSIDGQQIISQSYSSALNVNMRPAISDLNQDGTVLSVDRMMMSPPYSSPCTFTSRVMNGGGVVNWDTISWTGNLPSGSSVNLQYRIGNSPDLSSIQWIPITGSSPRTLVGSSRFIQYQAQLVSSDTAQTPDLQAVNFTYHNGSDLTAPTITSLTAAPDGSENAIVTWTTDELSDSLVQYGITPNTLTSSISSNEAVISHAVTLTGLTGGTTYYYRVSSKDAANNSATLPVTSSSPASFTMPPVIHNLIDTSTADFSAGSGSCAVDAAIGNGAVRLPLGIDENFSGPSLPTGWTSSIWNGTEPSASDGLLNLNGAQAYTTAQFGPGSSLEFTATFNAQGFQHVGFAGMGGSPFVPLNIPPWIMFSTGNDGNSIYARVLPAGSTDFNSGNDKIVVGDYRGSPHRFKIDWKADSIDFSVDGVLKISVAATISDPMRITVADYQSEAPNLSIDWLKLSPFISPCSFTSRVLDAGDSVNWETVAWNGSVPTGSNLSLQYRIGTSPDLTSAQWIPINGSSPKSLAGNSRYIQYQALLSSSDPTQTPNLQDVTFIYQPGADTTSPAISNLAALPDGTGNAIISWTTDEPSDSLIQYGTTPNILTASGSSVSMVTSHTIALSGLATGTTYYYRVTSRDNSNNSNTFPVANISPASFTTPAVVYTLTDTSVLDFSAGSSACVVDATIGDGAVRLPLTIDENFSGTTLPAGWLITPWSGGGTGTFSSGQLRVDGASVRNDTLYGPGRTLEFVATFKAEGFEHVGFGGGTITFNQAPIAMFSTRSSTNTLYTSLFIDGSFYDVGIAISSSLIGTPHRYRIDWKTTGFDFYVDGTLVSSRTNVITDQMRMAASDYNLGGASLSVDWMQLSPYVPPCIFTSRVLDATRTVGTGTFNWTSLVPAGTSITISIRTGNTSTPDASWTAFAPVIKGATLPFGWRYIQYQAQLDASDSTLTPVLSDVTIHYQEDLPPVTNVDSYNTNTDQVLTVSAPGVLANDTDPDGNPITADLVSGPSHGVLTLNLNGSFTYIPTSGYSGVDSFTYKANDGALDSGPATVTLHVIAWLPPLPSSFSGTIYSDNNSPTVGDIIEARILGQIVTSTEIQEGNPQFYNMDVPADNPFTPQIEGGVEGSLVNLILNNVTIATATWHSGTHNFDLNIFAIHLVPGWNLVSFNLHPVDISTAAVLASISGKYNLVYGWNATGAHSSSGNWMSFDPGVGFGQTLNQLTEKMGFWIHMKEADTLVVAGNAPVSTDITLTNTAGGWNLVGFPSVSGKTLPEALASHGVGTDFSLVYGYNASLTDPWLLFDRTSPVWANNLPGLTPGMGYWVKVSVSKPWSVSYP